MTAAAISTPRKRLYEARPCFAGEANHIGVPIQCLDEAGELITVALVCYQGGGKSAEARAAAQATAAVMAQGSALLEALEASWGFTGEGLTSGELIARANRVIAAAHSANSSFAALHARHLSDQEAKADKLGEAGEGASI